MCYQAVSESDVGFSSGSHSYESFRDIGDRNPVLEHVPQHAFVIGCERQIEPIVSALPVDLHGFRLPKLQGSVISFLGKVASFSFQLFVQLTSPRRINGAQKNG